MRSTAVARYQRADTILLKSLHHSLRQAVEELFRRECIEVSFAHLATPTLRSCSDWLDPSVACVFALLVTRTIPPSTDLTEVVRLAYLHAVVAQQVVRRDDVEE